MQFVCEGLWSKQNKTLVLVGEAESVKEACSDERSDSACLWASRAYHGRPSVVTVGDSDRFLPGLRGRLLAKNRNMPKCPLNVLCP
jgi:hypothetical protein